MKFLKKYEIGKILTHVAAPGCEKMFVVDAGEDDRGPVYHCRVLVARAGICRPEIVTFREFELMPFPSEDPAKKLAEHFDVVKEKAVEMQDFDLAAKIRNLMLDIAKTKDAP